MRILTLLLLSAELSSLKGRDFFEAKYNLTAFVQHPNPAIIKIAAAIRAKISFNTQTNVPKPISKSPTTKSPFEKPFVI
jgi:hypothetical protein